MSSFTATVLPTRAAFIESLQTTNINDSCSICMDVMAAGAVTLHDQHAFCSECAYRWLAANDNCPLCRAKLFQPEEEEQAAPDQISLPPLEDHTIFLHNLFDAVTRQMERHGTHWYLEGPSVFVLNAMISQGWEWGRGRVTATVSPAEVLPARRMPTLSLGARFIEADRVATAVLMRFMEQVVFALTCERWGSPALHPLTWQVLSTLLDCADSTQNFVEGLSAEDVEDGVEDFVRNGVRIPGRLDGCRNSWYTVVWLEEREQLPAGTREFVMDLVEEFMMAHERGASPAAGVVARRESSL